MADEKKQKSLESAIAAIEKKFGKGSIMNLNGNEKIDIDVIPTGCLLLDKAIGVGGVPRGRIVEIYGPESSGKTTLALHIVAEAQKLGGIVAYVDAEHALDVQYASKLGVDLNNFYVSQPDDGEQALSIVQELVSSGSLDVVVIDSVAALTPKAEIDGEMGDAQMGALARLMSQALRKLTAIIGKTGTCVIFINQIREKIGVMFGNPETTSGGRSLKYAASVRLDVRRVDSLKNNGEVYGNRTRVKVVKNKVAPPFKQCEFDMIFGEGISQIGCILDTAVDGDIVEKSGSWFSYNGEKIGQGREKTIQFLKDNPDVASEIEAKVRATF